LGKIACYGRSNDAMTVGDFAHAVGLDTFDSVGNAPTPFG
jgi:hypothetical protein